MGKIKGWQWLTMVSFMFLVLAGCQANSNGQDQSTDEEVSQGDEKVEDGDKSEENQEEVQEDALKQVALDYVMDIIKGNYQDAYSNYSLSDQMKDASSVDIYEQLATGVSEKYGDYKEVLGSGRDEQSGYIIWHVYVQYSEGAITWNVNFDGDNAIAGLNMTPYNQEANDEGAQDEETLGTQVTVGTQQYPLEGIYIKPEEGKPVVLLVQGSGASDRDETVGPNKPFKSIAEGLAAKGIGSLRYDKRTYVYGQAMASDMNLTFYEETVEDVLAAVNFLQDEQGINNQSIVILGHSMGGYLIPMIDEKLSDDGDIGGYILLAGNHRSLGTLLPLQSLYLAKVDGVITEDEQAEIDMLNDAFSHLDEAADDQPILGAYPAYWRADADYNPDVYAQAIAEPVLVLQGEADYQVTMEDFDLWKHVWVNKSNATFKSYPSLNHLMMPVEGLSTSEEYNIKTPMSEAVIQDISQWVSERQ